MKINPNGFREYDARWIFEKDIDVEGITNLGKGLGTQIIGHTKKSRHTSSNTTFNNVSALCIFKCNNCTIKNMVMSIV